MSRKVVQSILDQVRKLDAEDRVLLADEVDRLTWADRVESLISSLRAHPVPADPITEAEIDRIVDEVRSEKPLYERYWTRRQRSAR